MINSENPHLKYIIFFSSFDLKTYPANYNNCLHIFKFIIPQIIFNFQFHSYTLFRTFTTQSLKNDLHIQYCEYV